jgi:hypothetical protein
MRCAVYNITDFCWFSIKMRVVLHESQLYFFEGVISDDNSLISPLLGLVSVAALLSATHPCLTLLRLLSHVLALLSCIISSAFTFLNLKAGAVTGRTFQGRNKGWRCHRRSKYKRSKRTSRCTEYSRRWLPWNCNKRRRNSGGKYCRFSSCRCRGTGFIQLLGRTAW